MMDILTAIKHFCKHLKLPAINRDAQAVSEMAKRQQMDYLEYLRLLLETEHEERRTRRIARRIKEAGFPLPKTFESFDFSKAARISEIEVRKLSEGDYIDKAEPIIFIGEPGTGKSHLATALGMVAARQCRIVKFITAPSLATELIEARDAHELSRVVARYARAEVLILDELGYLPLGKTDAELLFQVLSERQEKKPTIVTTNLPFSEWTSMFSDQRLCRAVIDRLTHKAHIIETGMQSARLEETLKKNRRIKGAAKG